MNERILNTPACAQWQEILRKSIIFLDKKNVTCWYCGEVWFHYDLSASVILIHTHGKIEVFNSLISCLSEDSEILHQNYHIRGAEHPHRRRHLKETIGYTS